jgi:hypothetical protein
MILIIVPTLNRPGRLRVLAENARNATRAPSRVLYVTEAGDKASQREAATLEEEGLATLVVNSRKPCYAGAINAGYVAAADIPFTHFLIGADDILFRPGWEAAATDALDARPGLRVSGTNDRHDPMVMAGMIASHYLVDRRYIDETGGVVDEPAGVALSEAYLHAGACAEFHETACARGVWTPCLASIVEHHPYPDSKWHQPGVAVADEALFAARRHLWDNWRSRSYLYGSEVP